MEPTARSYSQGKASSPFSHKDSVSTRNSHTCSPRAAFVRDERVLSNSNALPLDLSSMKSHLVERDMIANQLSKPASDAYNDYLSNTICNKLHETKNDLIVNFDSFSYNSGPNYPGREGTKFSRCNPQSIVPSKLYDNGEKDLQLPFVTEKVCDTPNFSFPFSPVYTKTGTVTPNQDSNDSSSFCDSGYNSFSAPNSNRTKFVKSTPTLEPIKGCPPTCKVTPCITLDSDFEVPELRKDHLPTPEAPLCITLDSDSDFSDVDISAEDLRKELSSQDEDALLNMNLKIMPAAGLRGKSSKANTNTSFKTLGSKSTKEAGSKVSSYCVEEANSANQKSIANKDNDLGLLHLGDLVSEEIDLGRANFAASALRLWSEVETHVSSTNSSRKTTASNFAALAPETNNCGIAASSRRKSTSSLKNPKRASSKGRRKSKTDDPDFEASPAVHWSVEINECAVDIGKPVKLTFKRQLLSEVSPRSSSYSNEDRNSIKSSSKKRTSSLKHSESADAKVIGSPGNSFSYSLSRSPEIKYQDINAEVEDYLTLSKKSPLGACSSFDVPMTETQTSSKKPLQIVRPSFSLPLTETETLSNKPQQVACSSSITLSGLESSSKRPQQIVCPNSCLLRTETKTSSEEQMVCPSDTKSLSEKPQQVGCPSPNPPSSETETLSKKPLQVVCPSSSSPMTVTKPLMEKPQQLVCPGSNSPLLVTNDCDTLKGSVEKASSPKNVTDTGCKSQDKIDSPDVNVSSAVSQSLSSNTSAQNQGTQENVTSNEEPLQKICRSADVSFKRQKYVRLEVVEDCETFESSFDKTFSPKIITNIGCKSQDKIDSRDISALSAVSQSLNSNTSAQYQGTSENATSNEEPLQKICGSSDVRSKRQKYVRLEAVEDRDIPICFSGLSTSGFKNSQYVSGKAKSAMKEVGNSDISVSDGQDVRNSDISVADGQDVSVTVPQVVSPSSVSLMSDKNSETSLNLKEKAERKISSGSDLSPAKVKKHNVVKKFPKKSIFNIKNFILKDSDVKLSTENCEISETLKETSQQIDPPGSDLSAMQDKEHKTVKKSSKKSIFSLKNFIMKKSKTCKNFITKKSNKKKIRDQVFSLDISISPELSPSSKSSICMGNLVTPVKLPSSGKLQRAMKNSDSDSDENSSSNSCSSQKHSKSADSEVKHSVPSLKTYKIADYKAKNKRNDFGGAVVSGLPPSVIQSLKRICVVNLGTQVQLDSRGKPVLKVSSSAKIQSTKTQNCENAESSAIKKYSSVKNFADSEKKAESSLDPKVPSDVSQSSKSSKSVKSEELSADSNEKPKHEVCQSLNIISKIDKDSVSRGISSKKPTSSQEKIKSADKDMDSDCGRISSKKPTSSPEKMKSADSKTKIKKNEIRSLDTGLSPTVSESSELNMSAQNQGSPATSIEKSKNQVRPSSNLISTKNKNLATAKSSSIKPTSSPKNFKSSDCEKKSKKNEIGDRDVSVMPVSFKSNTSAQNQKVTLNPTSNEKPEVKVVRSSIKTLTKNKDNATVGSSSKISSSSSKTSKSEDSKAKIKKNDVGNSGARTLTSNPSLKPAKPSKSAMFTENFGKPILLTVNKKPPKKIHSSSNQLSKKDSDGDTVKCPSEKLISRDEDTKTADKTKNKKDDASSVLPAASSNVAVSDASLEVSAIKVDKVSLKSDKSQAKDLDSSSTEPATCAKSKSFSTSAPTKANLTKDRDDNADKCSSNSSSSLSKSKETIDARDKDIADSSILSANLSSCTFTSSKTTTPVLNSSAVTKKSEIFSNPDVLVIAELEKSIEKLASNSPLRVNQAAADTNINRCTSSERSPEKTTCPREVVEKVSNLAAKKDTQSLDVNISATAGSTFSDANTQAQDSNSAADVNKDSLLKPKLSLADYLGRSNTQSKSRVSIDSDGSANSYNKISNCANAVDESCTDSSRIKSDGSRGSHSFVNNEILTDTSFEKVVSDASKKLSSPFASKFLSSVRTPDKQASTVPNAELSKIISNDDNINNNYKTSCTAIASPDKVLCDQQISKIKDSMSPKNIAEDTASKTETQVNTTALKSPSSQELDKSKESADSQKITLGASQILPQETVGNSCNSNVVAKKRPLTGVSSSCKPTKVPREIKKRRRKLKWTLRKIDFEAPKEETLSTKFCRLGLILPNEKSPKTSSIRENTSISTDSISKNCDKSSLPEKSEPAVRGLESARTTQSDKGRNRKDPNQSTCIRSRRDPRLAGVLVKEKESSDLSLNLGDMNGKLQEAVNLCKLALKRKCETVVCERKSKNFKADSGSQDGSITDNLSGTSCDESKDSPLKKSSLFNKLIELNSPKMPRERVITLDESSSEHSDDDSVLSLATSDILPNDKSATGLDVDGKVTDTVHNVSVEGDITNKTVDIDITNKTIDIDITNRTIEIDITNDTIDINETATDIDKEEKDVANEVVDMDISQSPTHDDVRESPNCIEGLQPAEFYKMKCDSVKQSLVDPETMTNIGSEIRNLCKTSNHQIYDPRRTSSRCVSNLVTIETAENICLPHSKDGNKVTNFNARLNNCMYPENSASNRCSPNHRRECLIKHKLSAPHDRTQAGPDCFRQDLSSAAKSSLEVPSIRSKSPDFEAYESVLPQRDNFSKYQSFLPSAASQSGQPAHSLLSPFVDHFDVEPLEKSDFYGNDPEYLKPTNDWHYVDNRNETSSERLNTDDSVHGGSPKIAFGQLTRTDDPQFSRNSDASPYKAAPQPTDQSVPSLNHNEDDMDLSPGVDDTPLLPNESCSRIPLPDVEISYDRDSLPPNEISCSRIPLPEEISLGQGPLPPHEISLGLLPENEASCSRIPTPENEISFGKIPLPVEEELLRENETGSANIAEVGIGSEFRNESECRSGAWVEPAVEVAETRSDFVYEIPPSLERTEAPPSEAFEGTDDGIKEAEKLDHLNPAWDFWRKLDNDKDRYRGVRMAWRNSRIPNPKLNLTIRNSQRRNGFAPPASEMKGPDDDSGLPTIPCETVFMDQVAENIKKYDEKIDALQDSMEYELQTQSLNHENTIRNCSNPSAIPDIERQHYTALHKTCEFFEKQRDELIREKEANDLRLKTACNLVVSFHRFYDDLDGEKPQYSTRLTINEYEEIMEVNKILELYNTFYK